ncbi:MAG: S26 family signal peptidase [Planctomycetota bacterium]
MIFDPPARWETVVFRNPNDGMQAYVKRVVGLPGEKVRIFQGDIYINGRIARKSYEQFLELCLPVYHQCRLPTGTRNSDRWVPLTGGSEWTSVDDHLEINAVGKMAVDEIVYRHHDPDGFETSVRDDYGYNASRSVWHHDVVGDLLLRFLVTYKAGNGFLRVSVRTPSSHSFVIDADPNDGSVRLFSNERLVREGKISRWQRLDQPVSVGFFDQRLSVRFGDEAPFADFDIEDDLSSREEATSPTSQPFAVGVSDLGVEIHDLRIDRDIFYGSQVLESYNPAGVRKPFALGKDEYFVLGDNSPISNDSRIWENPAVRRSLFIGKPIVVHLPSQTWQGRVFGRQIPISLPDLGNVRRVR